jgi:hypothetical protein
MVLAQKEKVFLLLDNFSDHQVPNVGTRLRVTRLEFYLQTPQVIFNSWMHALLHLSRHNTIHQIDCFSANKVFAIYIYQVVVMLERAWRAGVTTSTIQNCWRHTGILSISIERQIKEARLLVKG